MEKVHIQPTHVSEWQSLTDFTASTTLSEKVWRVVHHLLFMAAGLSVCARASRKIQLAPPALSYASYALIAWMIRKIVATLIGYMVYPATHMLNRADLRKQEEKNCKDLQDQGFVIQRISLHKSGVTYDALTIGHPNYIANGKWVIYALGNGTAMEQCLKDAAEANYALGGNTLLINGPGVGRSTGYPTRYQMSAGFEAGLQFLEKKVKATHIAMQGYSLGGGMIAEAILAHQFDTSRCKYLCISKCTFSRLSTIAAARVGSVAIPAFFLTGLELDTLSGAEKLKKLQIPHIIVQHSSKDNQGTDGVIPDSVALAPALAIDPSRTVISSPDIEHNALSLPIEIQTSLDQHVKGFFQKP